jgi:predicted MFS family arabinose efflux permease
LSGRTEATASFFNSFDLGIGLGSMLLGILAGRMGTYGSVYLGGAAAAALWLVFYVTYYVILRRGGRK